MIEQRLLDYGLLGLMVLVAGFIVKFFYERNQQLLDERLEAEKQHNREISDLQVAFTETARDHYEQRFELYEKFNNQLLSLATSNAEMREKVVHTLQALEKRIDEKSTERLNQTDR